MIKNQLYTTEILGYSSDGQGIARIDGRAVFIPHAARGDIVDIRIVKVTNTAVYGKIEQIITPSPHRIEPTCSVAAQCGGCVYAHISYEEEFHAKTQQVVDALTRIAKCVSVPTPITIPAPTVTGYRNKALYPVTDIGGIAAYGFYRERSHDVVPITRCLLQNLRADAIANAVISWMNEYNIRPYNEQKHNGLVRNIFVRTSDSETIAAVICNGPPSRVSTLIDTIRAACPDCVGVLWIENAKHGNVPLDGKIHKLWGEKKLTMSLSDLSFDVGVRSFFQVNAAQAEKLYEITGTFANLSTGETAVDLYCGTGTLTLSLAKTGAAVHGIESVESAVLDARANAVRNNVNAAFYHADAGDGLQQLKAQGTSPSVIVVDPPRKGMSSETIEAISSTKPKRLVYVSCNPSTLARDIALLHNNGGYTLQQLAIVDMFPRTKHVECVALLETNISGM